jgi:pre-mRNA processing factor 4 (PRP4) like
MPEVLRRLRALDQPITLFGEVSTRMQRIHACRPASCMRPRSSSYMLVQRVQKLSGQLEPPCSIVRHG